MILPNPFLNSAESVSQPSPEQAVASFAPAPLVDAAADLSTASVGGAHGSPAAVALNPPETAGDLDATDCIGELLYYATKLGRDRRFAFDRARFMADIEEVPLFLRAVG